MLHAENGDVIDVLVAEALAAGHTTPEWHARTRPAWGAVEAVLRGAALAAQAGAPLYVVHMNVAGEVDQLAYARERGVPVMGETCPQYLFFTSDDLRRPDGAKWVCSPPVRGAAGPAAPVEGAGGGHPAGDRHRSLPFFYDGSHPILYEGQPVAIPGKELGQMISPRSPTACRGWATACRSCGRYGVRAGRMTPNQFVALNATQPARIFGMYPRKGTPGPRRGRRHPHLGSRKTGDLRGGGCPAPHRLQPV